MKTRTKATGVVVAALAAAVTALLLVTSAVAQRHAQIRHVLLISVDGMHQSDLTWYVANHRHSELAQLAGRGAQFSNALTSVPSDSDPGATALMTGGDPRATGVYYDVEYNHSLYEAGTKSCHGQPTGADVVFDSPDDINVNRLDAGQGIAGLDSHPSRIMQMTGDPKRLLNPATFPVDPRTCKPIWPHSYLKVNTMFEVIKRAGLRTAWSDKHAVYESFNGPSGGGIQDLFAPEIDSNAVEPNGQPYPGSIVWTGDNAATRQYDAYKVQAILNEINGRDHSGAKKVGVPAIFGMNFQTVSTAEKLPSSNGLAGGYLADGVTPGPLLIKALDYIDAKVGSMVAALKAQNLDQSTAIILSAKHGQSPTEPSTLTRIPDGPILSALNTAWHTAHPKAADPLVAMSINDDAMLLWLSDRSRTATRFAKQFLLGHSGVGNDIIGNPKSYSQAGLDRIYAGRAAARYFGVGQGDARVPDIFGIVQHGVVYTGGNGKIAEHGGADPQDRRVPLIVSGAGVPGGRSVENRVETTQIAPTILRLLGLNPWSLRAVQIEGTEVLPLR